MEWFAENWELICICFGILINALGVIYNVYRYVRAGGLRRTEGWQELLDMSRKYACEAEGQEGLSGAQKLEYVLTRLREYTDLMGFEYDSGALSALVSGEIGFANELNAIKSRTEECPLT